MLIYDCQTILRKGHALFQSEHAKNTTRIRMVFHLATVSSCFCICPQYGRQLFGQVGIFDAFGEDRAEENPLEN
jgi:hypothetical protein